MSKDFDSWNTIKKHLGNLDTSPLFKEGDIWWCSVGLNISHEADGKSQHFTRPVLIIRKFNKHLFLGIPLTTKIKDTPYYHPFNFRGKKQCVMLSQIRLWSSNRLRNRMGRLPKITLNEMKEKIRRLI